MWFNMRRGHVLALVTWEPEKSEIKKINFSTNSGTIETRTELAPKSLEIARNISTEIFVNSLLYYIKLGTIV